MEQIKINNFVKHMHPLNFPEYITIIEKECSSIYLYLARKLNLDDSIDGLSLVTKIDELGKFYGTLGNSINLKKIVSSIGLFCQGKIYINWHRYDNIDQMNLTDLEEYFDDIWYSSVDDIDIFDRSKDWIVSISHSGDIKILSLKKIKGSG